MTIPEAGRERLQAGIDRARMEKKRAERVRRRSAWTAAAAAVIVLIALPNTNMQIAPAMAVSYTHLSDRQQAAWYFQCSSS